MTTGGVESGPGPAALALLEVLERQPGPVEVRALVAAGAAKSCTGAFSLLVDLRRAGLAKTAGRKWLATTKAAAPSAEE